MLNVFLPCRKGSQRVERKNIRDFAGLEGGLLRLKLETLLSVENIKAVILSTNDPDVLGVARRFFPECERLVIDHRPDHLCGSDTSTDDLIRYVPSIIPDGHILWTHVTSPFLKRETFTRAIELYFENLRDGTHDSLMSVTPLQTFLWNESAPVNYDRRKEKWPRTQTLPKWYEVNSGLFMIESALMKTHCDRIGQTPFLFETDPLQSFDIDTQIQFAAAEALYSALSAKEAAE